MPSGPRIRSNNVFGLTTDNPLTAGATSFNSTSLFLLPAVSSAHAVIVLDPKRVNGEPEIVIVTAHTALATSATISRGAYGTTARSHPLNTQWAHVAVTDDLIPIVTSGTRPSDPFEGQIIYETDTHRPVHRDNTQWLPGGPVSVVTSGTRPANPYDGQTIFETDTLSGQIRHSTAWNELYAKKFAVQVISTVGTNTPNGADTVINFDTFVYDFSGGSYSLASDLYTVPMTGLYYVAGYYTVNGGATVLVPKIYINGSVAYDGHLWQIANASAVISIIEIVAVTAGQTIQFRVNNSSGSGSGSGVSNTTTKLPRMTIYRLGPQA